MSIAAKKSPNNRALRAGALAYTDKASLPYIHINTAKHLLAQPEPVNLVVWKSDGSLIEYNNVISLKQDFYKGTRTIKCLRSGQIRLVRDILIYKINSMCVIL